jgi:hypothetical protein
MPLPNSVCQAIRKEANGIKESVAQMETSIAGLTESRTDVEQRLREEVQSKQVAIDKLSSVCLEHKEAVNGLLATIGDDPCYEITKPKDTSHLDYTRPGDRKIEKKCDTCEGIVYVAFARKKCPVPGCRGRVDIPRPGKPTAPERKPTAPVPVPARKSVVDPVPDRKPPPAVSNLTGECEDCGKTVMMSILNKQGGVCLACKAEDEEDEAVEVEEDDSSDPIEAPVARDQKEAWRQPGTGLQEMGCRRCQRIVHVKEMVTLCPDEECRGVLVKPMAQGKRKKAQ